MWVLEMTVSIFAFHRVCYLNAWMENECCLESHGHTTVKGKHQKPFKGLVCHAIQ